MTVRLRDLSPELRAQLAPLTRRDLAGLAIDLDVARDRAEEAAWPRDPAAAAGAAEELLGRAWADHVEDPLLEVQHSLDLAVTLLGTKSGCDAPRALEWLLYRAQRIVRDVRPDLTEARRRLAHLEGGERAAPARESFPAAEGRP